MSINKRLTIFLISIILLSLHLMFPLLEFNYGNKIYIFSHDVVIDEFEEHLCYSESVSYVEDKDISITSWESKRVPFGFFKLTFEYEEGNLCDYEYVLEEAYITNFLENAKIDKDSDDVDLEKLIEGKKAIVSNTKYPWNDDYKWIGYELDGKYQEMFISTTEDGMVIIQVGLSDEGPKYIAYKDAYEIPKGVDYSEYDFVGKTWTRTMENDTEYLSFKKDGSFSYYCACGNPVDDADLCEYYTYDGDDTIYVHCDFDKYTKKKVEIISLKKDKLKIDFNGDVRVFELED